MPAKPIMIQGTMSNAGKSLLTAGLCRVLTNMGYNVAPFKSQNMALNSFITKDGEEMGRAQVVQAEACKKQPSALMNPILLKPTTDVGSQVIVGGKSIGNYSAVEYFKMKKTLIPDIMKAYNQLASENDIIVIEGAGSPAEINLKTQDIVNMGMAEMVDAPVLLVGDIDRGGVFAQLYGTVELLEQSEKDRIKGLIINKFRGDKSILQSGLTMLENLTNKPVVGVVPFAKVDIDDEDSLSQRIMPNSQIKDIDIAIIRLPRMSNFTDFAVFERFESLSVRYVEKVSDLKNPDLIIIPGTKSTIEDLKWLKTSGFESLVSKHVSSGGGLFGVCGGYQMLGKSIEDKVGVEGGGSVIGLGFLDIHTVFESEKHTTQVAGRLDSVGGIFACLSGCEFSGYEIHNGKSSTDKNIIANGNVYGSYIHGIFDGGNIARDMLYAIAKSKNITVDLENFDELAYKDSQYEKLAKVIEDSVDIGEVLRIIGVNGNEC
ncbi:MAG: cobyric acid synthase [Bacillota bacterium]